MPNHYLATASFRLLSETPSEGENALNPHDSHVSALEIRRCMICGVKEEEKYSNFPKMGFGP